ncbi:hypothetical protein G6F68_011749 [Rhizopus microsporus]|nr:hypothetical protein G6F68_011749 [Rhizopus microsporus]
MVHQHQRRAVGLFGQARGQPVQPVLAQFAVALHRHDRVQRQQAQRIGLDGVLDERAFALQIRVVGKGDAQFGAVVMVAGQEEIRNLQRLQVVAQHLVFVGAAQGGQGARDQHAIGPRIQGVQRAHGRAQEGGGIDDAVGLVARGAHVQVGDLCDEHDADQVSK